MTEYEELEEAWLNGDLSHAEAAAIAKELGIGDE